MTGRAGPARGRLTESRLTAGLAEVYRRGYTVVLVLMLFALLGQVSGWAAVDDLARIGIVVLLSVPIVSTLWVGREAVRGRDRGLGWIVAGILGLMIAATILPPLLQGGS